MGLKEQGYMNLEHKMEKYIHFAQTRLNGKRVSSKHQQEDNDYDL
jgi:hypothetical protein